MRKTHYGFEGGTPHPYHYRDALRGYRLTKAAKEMLLSVSPLRFQCYLTGNTETNLIRSEVSRRIRLHQKAETYLTLLHAGDSLLSGCKT